MNRILIDHRERKANLSDALLGVSQSFDARWTTLSLGDYLIDERLLIERKSMLDLVESIKDGRLFTQAQRMAKLLRRNRHRSWRTSAADAGPEDIDAGVGSGLLAGVQVCALLIEGRASRLTQSQMDLASIRAALATVSLFIGVPVLRSTSPGESVALLVSLSGQLQAIAHGALPRSGLRPTGKRGIQLHLLQGIPGVGPRRAAALIKRFGSVREAMLASEAEIAEIDGIGPDTARKIVWSVSERQGVYRAGQGQPAAVA